MSQNQVSTNQLMNALLVGFMEMSKMNQQLKQELADVKASQARIEAYFSSASGLDGKIESLWKATFLTFKKIGLEAFCTFFPEVWSNEELRKTLLQKVKETVPREPAEVQKGLEKKLWGWIETLRENALRPMKNGNSRKSLAGEFMKFANFQGEQLQIEIASNNFASIDFHEGLVDTILQYLIEYVQSTDSVPANLRVLIESNYSRWEESFKQLVLGSTDLKTTLHGKKRVRVDDALHTNPPPALNPLHHLGQLQQFGNYLEMN
jgi:hypothetical protein